MTTIGGGPGDIAGPNGPRGPDGADPVAVAADDAAGHAVTPPTVQAVAASTVEALAAELASGRLTSGEVTRALIDRVVAASGGAELDAAQRAELRELLTDLVTNDPYLGGLVGQR